MSDRTLDSDFTRESECRSCKARIVWALMSGSGKRNPLDRAPAADGTIVIESWQATEHGMSPLVRVLHGEEREVASRRPVHVAFRDVPTVEGMASMMAPCRVAYCTERADGTLVGPGGVAIATICETHGIILADRVDCGIEGHAVYYTLVPNRARGWRAHCSLSAPVLTLYPPGEGIPEHEQTRPKAKRR